MSSIVSRFRFVAVCISVLLPSVACCADAPKVVRLTILHTNDTHGHLLPFSYPETFDGSADIAQLAFRSNIGGAARRATLVKRIRAEKGHETLLIDAGDICDGTPFSTEYHGDADIAAMNAIGYDLACPGNHEYSNPLTQVRKMIGDAHFPLISANSTVRADGKSVYTPYVIKTIGGARIAFIGLMTYDARTYPAAKTEILMEPPMEAAARLVPGLRARADIVIAVTHIGLKEDQLLATTVPGIDLIVGGHSHTLIPHPLTSAWMPSDSTAVRPTIIVQDHQWGGTLGRLDVTLNRSATGTWSIGTYRGELLPVTSTIPEDPSVAAVVDHYWKPIAPKYGEVVAQAEDDFAEKGGDFAHYNLVADAVRESAGVDFDLENVGGVRAPLIRGPITYGDLVTMDPFGNTIFTFRASGRQIKQILARNRPAVSGIRYVLTGGEVTEATIGGKPVEDDRTYSGATNSYLAPFILKDIAEKTDTGKPRLDALIAYLRAKRSVKPLYDGRRVIRAAVRS